MNAITIAVLLAVVASFGQTEPLRADIVFESVVAKDQGYFPVALRLKDGRIAVVMRGGAPHLGVKGRLDIVVSPDDGRSWSTPAVVDDSPVDDRNPAFGQAADGSLVVGFWRTARYDESGRYSPSRTDKPTTTWVTRSKDGNKWDEQSEVDVSDINYGSPYGRIIRLPDDSLLMAVYGEQIRKQGERIANAESWSYLYRSTDHGTSWRRHSVVGAKRFNETSILRLRNGALLAAMRSASPEQAVWISKSDDQGKTWKEPTRVTPPKHHPGDLAELDDGRVLLTVGKRIGEMGVVGIVADSNGDFKWDKHFVLISDAANTDCGYPSSVICSGNQALTLYYAVGRRGKADWRTHCGAVLFKLPTK